MSVKQDSGGRPIHQIKSRKQAAAESPKRKSENKPIYHPRFNNLRADGNKKEQEKPTSRLGSGPRRMKPHSASPVYSPLVGGGRGVKPNTDIARLLLQDLHDTHLCNTLLVAESEEDIWKTESPYTSYRPRALTTEAIQSLRSVLNAFSVVNRKNMFVYQERATKSVFYLRLSETSGNGRLWDLDSSQSMMSRSLALSRSQEPIFTEDMTGSRLSLELPSSRSTDTTRPVGQMDKHILLLVHGVGEAGSEITDDLVKVLRKRLDEATLDIITVMLQRNCKLTPADVEFIQPRGTPPTEVLQYTIPQASLPCLQAMAYYLRQNLLIFLHTPKYTDSNGEHHFQHYFHHSLPELDLFLYNKPGGQGTGGKGIGCIALSFVTQHGALVTQAYGERAGPPLVCPSTTSHLLSVRTFESLTKVSRFTPDPSNAAGSAPMTLVRFDVWEKGNISSSQLSERLSNSLRHALCDVIIEFHILQMPLCVDPMSPGDLEAPTNGKGPSQSLPDMKGLVQSSIMPRPAPVNLPPLVSPSSTDPSTPPSRAGRRSFWDILSKPDSAELGPPKTTDDIVCERTEEPRTRRRHKTESVKGPSYPDRPGLSLEHAQRKRQTQLDEGEVGTLHPLYSHTCLQWMNFMSQLGCPSMQLSSGQTVSRFLLPSILTELFSIITSLASDTTVRVFEKCNGPEGPAFVPFCINQNIPSRPAAARELILLGRNFRQWRCNTEQELRSLFYTVTIDHIGHLFYVFFQRDTGTKILAQKRAQKSGPGSVPHPLAYQSLSVGGDEDVHHSSVDVSFPSESQPSRLPRRSPLRSHFSGPKDLRRGILDGAPPAQLAELANQISTRW
ncbi:unnamed protein product [Ranitomeya imitator]|uniref:Uncharacterized protein n=1 Tax=Ranitomeya imitator TaxID=111125 RepID=A0ABN9MIA9_9NEOB|nr:unnamed protein product [Ranitomeya imitator]